MTVIDNKIREIMQEATRAIFRDIVKLPPEKPWNEVVSSMRWHMGLQMQEIAAMKVEIANLTQELEASARQIDILVEQAESED